MVFGRARPRAPERFPPARMYWLALGATAVAAGFDMRSKEIPNTISIVLGLAALIAAALGLHPLPWWDIALGFGVAFGGSFLLFALGVLGGGDVKLLAALGLTLGLRAFLPFVLITSVAGGALALLALRRGRTEIAYAPAMLVGLLLPIPFVLMA